MNGNKRRLGVITGTVAALLLLAAPATALAAAHITFSVSIGYECIYGDAAPNATAWVTWKGSNGALKERSQVVTSANGGWELCSDSSVLRSGDTIKVNDGVHVRTLTVPALTVVLDRVHDSLRGLGPVNATGWVYWHAGLYADYYYSEEVATDANGLWSFTPQDDDITGGIDGSTEWTTAAGDTFSADGMAPFVEVTLGRAGVHGGTSPFTSMLVKLRDPETSTLKGTARVVGGASGYFTGQFQNSADQPVVVEPGNRVVSTAATDLDWIVPNVETTADVANDFVNGRCYSTDIAPFFIRVDIYRTGIHRGMAFRNPDEDGLFSIDFGRPPTFMYDPANIKHGDRIETTCGYDTGDIVKLITRVP